MRTLLPGFGLLVPFVGAACHAHSESDSAPAEPLVVNLGVAAERVFGSGDVRLVAASEEASGLDLDGDGDTADDVLQILDLSDGKLTNTGLAFPLDTLRNQPSPRDGDAAAPPRFACNEDLGVFQVSEAETGADLNHDGKLEVLSWIFERRTGLLVPMPFAHTGLALGGDLAALSVQGDGALRVFDGLDGSLTTRAFPSSALCAAGDGLVAFTLAEDGGSDWNADGDTSDAAVLQIYDGRSRSVRNSALAIAPGRVRIAGGFVGFDMLESANGGLDLNGDGDGADTVFVALEGSTGLTRILPFGATLLDMEDPDLDAAPPPGFFLGVPEKGGDRNGDGDTRDTVAAFYDPRSERLFDTGLATSVLPMARTGRWIGFSVPEAQQGADLDRDGRLESVVAHALDTETGRSVDLSLNGVFVGALAHQLLGLRVFFDADLVLHTELFAWDPRTERTFATGVDVEDLRTRGGTHALLLQRENGRDLNGDADERDLVLGVYDEATGTVRNLGLATTNLDPLLGPLDATAVLVSEPAQGADLNGDGDERDDVLYWIDFTPAN